MRDVILLYQTVGWRIRTMIIVSAWMSINLTGSANMVSYQAVKPRAHDLDNII